MLAKIVCLAALGGFLFGYDLGVIGAAMLGIIDAFKPSSSAQELIVGATKLGAFFGTFIGGVTMLRYGRRPAIGLQALFFVSGPVVMAAATGIWLLVAGRFLAGLGIGASAIVVPAYLAEIAPPSSRGSIVQMYEVMLTLGMLSAQVINALLSTIESPHTWRAMLGLPALPAILLALSLLRLPESPKWLVMRGDLDAALYTLHHIITGKAGCRRGGGSNSSSAHQPAGSNGSNGSNGNQHGGSSSSSSSSSLGLAGGSNGNQPAGSNGGQAAGSNSSSGSNGGNQVDGLPLASPAGPAPVPGPRGAGAAEMPRDHYQQQRQGSSPLLPAAQAGAAPAPVLVPKTYLAEAEDELMWLWSSVQKEQAAGAELRRAAARAARPPRAPQAPRERGAARAPVSAASLPNGHSQGAAPAAGAGTAVGSSSSRLVNGSSRAAVLVHVQPRALPGQQQHKLPPAPSHTFTLDDEEAAWAGQPAAPLLSQQQQPVMAQQQGPTKTQAAAGAAAAAAAAANAAACDAPTSSFQPAAPGRGSGDSSPHTTVDKLAQQPGGGDAATAAAIPVATRAAAAAACDERDSMEQQLLGPGSHSSSNAAGLPPKERHSFAASLSSRFGAFGGWRRQQRQDPLLPAAGPAAGSNGSRSGATMQQQQPQQPGRESSVILTLIFMLRDIFIVATGPERRAFAIACWLSVFNQLNGSTALVNYAPILLTKYFGASSHSTALAVPVAMSVLKVLGVLVAVAQVERIGRKTLLGVGAMWCATWLLCAAVGMWMHSMFWFIVSLCGFVVAFSCSWAGVYWVVVSELFSMGTKSPATSAATSLLFLGGAVANFAFLSMIDLISAWTLVVFAVVSFVSCGYVLAKLPETKGKTQAEIQALLNPAAAAAAAASSAARVRADTRRDGDDGQTEGVVAVTVHDSHTAAALPEMSSASTAAAASLHSSGAAAGASSSGRGGEKGNLGLVEMQQLLASRAETDAATAAANPGPEQQTQR